MTNLNAASMHRAIGHRALIVIAGLAATLLAGCETASSIFGGSSPEVATSVAPAAGAGVTPAAQAGRIAVQPVMGAPDTVAIMMTERLTEAVERQKVTVAKGKDAAAEYYVRGYVVAAKDVAGTKLSYIWDITDKVGSKRAHRIQDEQIVKAAPGAAGGQDPWANVDAKVVQGLADKTAGKIAQWLSTQQPGPAPSPAMAQAQPSAVPQKAVATAPAPPATTASISRKSDGTAFIADVAGAPGDGSKALAAALRRELERKSVALVDTAASGSNRVEGRVSVSQPAGGKQVVQIEWIVTDSDGNQLGVVSQKNTIQQGSLDGPWGQTAESAASAAAVKIAGLLKPRVN